MTLMNFASNLSVAPNQQTWLPAVVGIIVAVFSGGGIAALIKSRPEGSKILIDAAAGVVVVQTGVITELRDQLKDAQSQINELRGLITEMSSLRIENDQLKLRVSAQQVEIRKLRERVAELELQNKTQTP